MARRAPPPPAALLALAALLVCVLANPATAQRMPREWVTVHSRDAMAQLRDPRGAIPVLRLWAQREWVQPSWLAEQLHAIATAPGAPMAVRSAGVVTP